jgi:hypothetical protein
LIITWVLLLACFESPRKVLEFVEDIMNFIVLFLLEGR